ncbi:MAG TPA: AAA family ATPase, partial [Ktedonobacteraceae bacterium]|nr:AAA family ATPase [Ktedonobacteraceae bacterium]
WNLSQRLNLITGDNGLGKTFLLECSWWALTGTWAKKYQAYPRHTTGNKEANIAFHHTGKGSKRKLYTTRYDQKKQSWGKIDKSEQSQNLVVFAQADGSMAIWDPAKNEGEENLIRLSPQEIFDGLREEHEGRTRVICNGLLQDWITWQDRPGRSPFHTFSAVLKTLAPHPTEDPLIPGTPQRLSLDDVREFPTLHFAYGDVPIPLCSAGIQRIVSLAYILVWAWNEHVEASKLLGQAPQHNIVLLVDEMESHLHPFWQRAITPALMDVIEVLDAGTHAQLLITTHSPLVLASVENRFDPKIDRLFHIYMQEQEVKLNNIPFVKRGRVDLWLMSDLFGLKQPRSKIAEEVIEEAKFLQQTKEAPKEMVQEVTAKLTKVLAQDDEFWPRWTYFAEQRGVML